MFVVTSLPEVIESNFGLGAVRRVLKNQLTDTLDMSSANKRLSRDLTAAQDPSVAEQGIWYALDPADMRKGRALIRGIEKTPYEGCLGVFDILFPDDYPFSPPKVTWMTSDGITRFHPQLYREGKVCLSILGTWQGPGWSASLNLVSVLQVIQSLFVDNPLSNEPGFEKGTLEEDKFRWYAEYVEHQFATYMIRQTITWKHKTPAHPWYEFEETIDEILPSCLQTLREKIKARVTEGEKVWNGVIFCTHHTVRSDWGSLLPKIEAITE